MKHFIVYNAATGTVLRSGVCQDHDLVNQAIAEQGEAVMETSGNAVTVAEINLGPVRDALYAKIDADAEAVRLRFITPGAGQAITYLWKTQEAKDFLADATTPVPILEAEAAALGKSVADLAAEVLAATQQWLVIGTKIEAARRVAKTSVGAATNVAQMHAAATIDWQAVLS